MAMMNLVVGYTAGGANHGTMPLPGIWFTCVSESLGAKALNEWFTMRVDSDALDALANRDFRDKRK